MSNSRRDSKSRQIDALSKVKLWYADRSLYDLHVSDTIRLHQSLSLGKDHAVCDKKKDENEQKCEFIYEESMMKQVREKEYVQINPILSIYLNYSLNL